MTACAYNPTPGSDRKGKMPQPRLPVSLGKSIISFGFEERPSLKNMIESDEGGHFISLCSLYKFLFPTIHLHKHEHPYKMKIIYIPIPSTVKHIESISVIDIVIQESLSQINLMTFNCRDMVWTSIARGHSQGTILRI